MARPKTNRLEQESVTAVDHLCRYDKLTDLSPIGQGGFGQVYKARHTDWGIVAYKELPDFYTRQTVAVLDQEVSIHKRLRHHNIVTYMALVYELGHKGIIMHFQPYGDAKHFLTEFSEVDWAWRLHMIYDIVLGMNYLHTQERPVIHGDLKAKNVLIGNGYIAKIADFGLAFWKQLTFEKTCANPGGTVTHIPPESWANINARRTEKYDIYGFGVLLWEILAHPKQPFHRDTAEVIRRKVLHGDRPPLDNITHHAPQFMKQLVVNCWNQEPSLRPTFRQIKEELSTHINSCKADINKAWIKLAQHEKQVSNSSTAAAVSTSPADRGTVHPVSVQDCGTANPVSVQDRGTANPVSVQDHGTAHPVSIQDHGTANPVSVQDSGTAHPVSVQDHGTANPVSVQDCGTANPVSVQDHGTAHPVSVQDHGTVHPVSVQDRGTANPMSVQDPGTVNPVSVQDRGTANPVSVQDCGIVTGSALVPDHVPCYGQPIQNMNTSDDGEMCERETSNRCLVSSVTMSAVQEQDLRHDSQAN